MAGYKEGEIEGIATFHVFCCRVWLLILFAEMLVATKEYFALPHQNAALFVIIIMMMMMMIDDDDDVLGFLFVPAPRLHH